jgi:hypothetical protein
MKLNCPRRKVFKQERTTNLVCYLSDGVALLGEAVTCDSFVIFDYNISGFVSSWSINVSVVCVCLCKVFLWNFKYDLV